MSAGAPIFTAADDGFHFASMSDRWWETETAWFSFHDAQRHLGGWVYVMVRPNIGTVAGGAWVWDAAAHLPWEVLYNTNYTALRLPEDQDLTDIELPTGVRLRMLEPLTSYAIGYHDPGRLEMDLRFDAVMPPQPLASVTSSFGHLSHFDQVGRVIGRITLHGEQIPIDCFSMRDRSWGPRPEHRPRRTAYVTGVADAGNSFLMLTSHESGIDVTTHGFLCRDGEIHPLIGGARTVDRDPDGGWVSEVRVSGTDAAGRTFGAVGRPLSHITINRHSMIDSNSLLEWDLDGLRAWGEDQDLWPIHEWSSHRRASRAARRG